MTQVSRAVGMMERQELDMEDVLFTQGDAGERNSGALLRNYCAIL